MDPKSLSGRSERFGRGGKGSRLPNASATPDTNPATAPIIPRPIHPPKLRDPCPRLTWSMIPPPAADEAEKPSAQVHKTSGRFTDGANQPQNATAVRAPVMEEATNPARDLRGASGRPNKRRGSALVFLPQRRPNVEALVSAQDRLLRASVKGRLQIRVNVYIRMDTTAISKGKKTRASTTPRIYQITPFVDFFGNEVSGKVGNPDQTRFTFSLSRIKKPRHRS